MQALKVLYWRGQRRPDEGTKRTGTARAADGGGGTGGRLWTLRQPVHDHATLALMEAFRRPETVLHSLAEYRSGVTAANAHSGSEAHRQRLQQEREARERELDDLLLREMRADPEEAASIARVRAALRAEVKRLTQALQQLEAPVLRLPELEEVADLLPKMARVFPAYWEEAPGEVKRAVARAMIRSLTVTVTPYQTCIRSSG